MVDFATFWDQYKTALPLIFMLYNDMGERLVSLTAHNGIDDMHGREFDAKGEAIHRMVKEINEAIEKKKNAFHIL